MLHADRVWCLAEVASAEKLAANLSEQTWCLCQAFSVNGNPQYVWLNDSISEDSAQEFAVVKLGLAKGDMRQLESITFSWSTASKAADFIHETLDGRDDHNDFARQVKPTIQSPEEHGRCHHCA